MNTLLVKVKEMFSFQQGLNVEAVRLGERVRLIVDSCQLLKKLSLHGVEQFFDDDVIHVIKKLGKQLTTLSLSGGSLTDVAYTYLKNCAR